MANSINSLGCTTPSYLVDRPELEHWCYKKACDEKQIVLIGSRGCGKSQVANKVAHRICQNNGSSCSTRVCRCIEKVDGTSEEALMSLIGKLEGRTKKESVPKVIIIDGINQNTQHLLHDLKRVFHPDGILITTTLDENQESEESIPIPSFSSEEFHTLIQNLTKDKDLIPEELIEEFHDELEGNPLDLYCAIQYLKRTNKAPEDLLQCLREGHACMLSNERAMFRENEYCSSLRSVLKEDLEEIMNSLNDFPLVKEALFALAFFDKNDIPIHVFSAVFHGKKQYDVVDVLLEKFKSYSLGKVKSTENNRQLLKINRAVQRALISLMDEEQIQRSLELTYKILLHLCHKDNRFIDDYQSQVKVEPHIKSVLDQKLVKRSIGMTILEVWLYSTLGHFYIQTDQLVEGERHLDEAIRIIEKDFLKGNVKLFDLKESDVQGLFELSEPDEVREAIGEFVQSLRISSSDIKKWSYRAPALNKYFNNKVTSLTPELYEQLVENRCAYETKKVARYFVAEEVATVLYTYGRLFIYNRQDQEKKKRALSISKMICRSIEATFDDVKLLHTELVDRNGLLCFNLLTAENEQKSVEQTKREALATVQGYQEILNDSCDRYEYGVLKCVKNEQYHKMVCWRYTLKANRVLFELNGNGEEGLSYKKNILDSIDELDKITGDRCSATGNLQRNSSIQMEIASALLPFEDVKHLDDALKRCKDVCEMERKSYAENSTINYPWLSALKGRVKLFKIWRNRDETQAVAIGTEVKKDVKLFTKCCRKTGGYEENVNSANNLLNDLDNILKELEIKEITGRLYHSSLSSSGSSPMSSICTTPYLSAMMAS